MIADDEHYMLEAMENLIDWKKMECELIYKAPNGQVLLEEIRKNPPDMIQKAIGKVSLPVETEWEEIAKRFVCFCCYCVFVAALQGAKKIQKRGLKLPLYMVGEVRSLVMSICGKFIKILKKKIPIFI